MTERENTDCSLQRQTWTKPILASASIKELTSGGGFSGTDASLMMMMASDQRLKSEIQQIGVSIKGIPIHSFRYVWGGPTYAGVLAQNILSLRPDAVSLDTAGYYRVDYGKLDIPMRRIG